MHRKDNFFWDWYY